MKILFKSVLIVVLFATIGGVGSYFILSKVNQNKSLVISVDNSFGWKFPVTKFPVTGSGDQLAYSNIRDPGGIPQGLPVRLKIPIINVNSAVEDALITPDGRMDVPVGSVNVAWFALGPHPGQVGSAVIGGHFGISNGVPFVFYNLDKLKAGDKVYVEDDQGNTLAFQVREIKLFDRDADATTVFTSDDGLAHLNIITCEGVWNQVNGSYPERRVVFTDAVLAEGATPAPIIVAPTRSLSPGARGVDVIMLQTLLVQKGLLKMPRGVAMGYYGLLTRAAVAKYQISVGLPANGIFAQSTRNKLIPKSSVTINLTLPQTAIESSLIPPVMSASSSLEKVLFSFQLFIQTLSNLYATPLDGLITFSLLILILLVAYKIFKR